MTEPLPEDQRLKEISSKAYEHPADRAATAALQSIPMLDQVVRKLIEYGYERALRQVFMAGSVKLGSDQMPEIWAAHRAAIARLDMTEVPDLYLTQFPVANAAAIGSGRPMVVVNSGLVNLLDEHEMRTVLGHEAAHILSDHVLYRTALMILLSASGLARMPFLRRPAADRRADGAAGVVPRRRAVRRPGGHAGQPRPAGDLPDADGAGRRDRRRASSTSTPSSARPPPTRSGSPAGTSSRACGSRRARRTPSRSSASRS